MGRCRGVSWPAILLVWFVGVLAGLVVWFIRSMINHFDKDYPEENNAWGWDWFDVVFGVLLFVFAVGVGVVLACPFQPVRLMISSVFTSTPSQTPSGVQFVQVPANEIPILTPPPTAPSKSPTFVAEKFNFTAEPLMTPTGQALPQINVLDAPLAVNPAYSTATSPSYMGNVMTQTPPDPFVF